MNPNKILPTIFRTCAGICCSDCGYYDVNVSIDDCEQRKKLLSEHCKNEEKLRRERLNKIGILGV